MRYSCANAPVPLLGCGMGKGLWSVLYVCVATVLAAAPPLDARNSEKTIRQFHHTAWTVKNGAPPDIWALDQGADGFLWLGTGSGLYRFDGISFERFRPQPGERLASIDITAVNALASGEIWIGYSGGGVSRVRDGRVTTFQQKDGIWPGMVVGVIEDRDGVLWAVAHGGLSRFDGGRWVRVGADWNAPTDMTVGLFVARDGALWLSTARSVYFCRPGARRFEPTGAVTGHATFTQTPDGRLWIADGLNGLRPLPNYPAGESQSPWALKPATPTDILSVANYAIDRQGGIWGTDRVNGGIFRFDPARTKPPTHSLQASDVDRFRRTDGLTSDRSIPIVADREGNIWVGTNAGLNRFRDAAIVTDKTGAFAYSVAATPEATYISDGAWLYRASPDEPARPFARLPADAHTMLFGARNGALWYYNLGFVHRFHDNTLTRIALPAGEGDDYVRAIAEDGAGTLWVSLGRSGVYQLKDGVWSGKVDLGGLPAPQLAGADAAGSVWFGFADGRVSRTSATATRVFSTIDGLDIGDPEVIAVHDGAVWVGGEFGVARLANDRFHTVGPGRLAPFFGISGIGRTADGDFLFNGLSGVVRMKTDDVRRTFADPAYAPAYELYDHTDGLPGVAQQGWYSPTVVTGADGRTWFISNTGVAFLAGKSHRNHVPPPVTILSATSDGVGYSVASRLTLPTGASSLAIAYTAASLGVPEKVRFRYRLEGLDPDWVDAGAHREAAYNNLGPGDYRFRVIAANDDGVWNTDGATLAIEIPPTFVQSGSFKVLCALAAAGLLWLAYSMRLRVVADRIRMRMAERMEERERIARELHDTLLQSVQALTLRFQLAVDDLPKDAHARATLEEAIDRADAVIAEGRDRVRDLRAPRDSDVERIIADIVERQGFDPGVEITMTTTGASRALEPLVLEEATRIASEAIFNIWRHACADRVAINIGHGANFSLRLADNGVGIAREVSDRGQKDGHFGLAGMSERARNLHGWLVVRSLPEGGTEVKLTVPGQIAYKSVERRISLW
jgi:signal transduction histidine kinase/ligand-binding sensor domain-containing protein